jgi:hypothetical protein
MPHQSFRLDGRCGTRPGAIGDFLPAREQCFISVIERLLTSLQTLAHAPHPSGPLAATPFSKRSQFSDALVRYELGLKTQLHRMKLLLTRGQRPQSNVPFQWCDQCSMRIGCYRQRLFERSKRIVNSIANFVDKHYAALSRQIFSNRELQRQ